MDQRNVTRRALLKGGGATLAGFSVLHITSSAHGLTGEPNDDDVPFDDEPGAGGDPPELGDDGIPWDDQPDPIPPPLQDAVGDVLEWEQLNSRITPNDQFFRVRHYGRPDLDATDWRLDIDGLVAEPRTLSLDDLKGRRRQEVEFTLECSGNTGLPFFIGGVGNARWAGTRLAPLLEKAEPSKTATEVIFWGADRGTVTIRDNSGVLSGGFTGTTEPDAGGGLDLTITEQFARSMSLDDAMKRDNLLCYEMNAEPLPVEHGFPVRLIAPGWYGVANVKWLTRIQVTDRRYAGRFMARDYVTFRENPDGSDPELWTFNTVGRDRLKSAPAKVTQRDGRYTIIGVAWGAAIETVEVSIDGSSWMPATLFGHSPRHGRSMGVAWRLWTFDWGTPAAGAHEIASRATDVHGNVQPPPEDPFIASRRTYWENNGQITRHVTIA
jgi:DMSO/TMAO reductase YedYZ molybdopterin-dependent catalytic subunit